MKTNLIKIDTNWCKGCQLCINACPNQLIGLSEGLNQLGFHFAVINDPEKCRGCGLCAQMCPDIAIQIWEYV